MGYHITHVLGNMESSPGEQAFGPLFDELREADDEHPDVFVRHETGWSLGISRTGRAYLENVEDDSVPPRHLDSVDRDHFVALAAAVAKGDVAAIESEDWRPGY